MAAQGSVFNMAAPAATWRPVSIKKAETSSINYRTWFKRIALFGWVIYAAGIILLPFWDEAKERNLAFDRALASYQACKTIAAERGISEKQSECENVYQARKERDEEAYRFGSELKSIGWHLAWVVPAVLFLPPLIFYFFVYGTILGLVKTVNYLGRGCRS